MDRDSFNSSVLHRDDNLCVTCKQLATAVHHIIDRSLWSDGGYYIDNGVSLCDLCHILAEQTNLSCSELRYSARIQNIILPDHFFNDENYDKWGNIILPSGARIKGELFNTEAVQKILPQSIKDTFLPYIKYPRTYHVPWSENLQNDDRMHDNVDFFLNKEIVVTIKLDGENTNLYPDYIHARSIDSKHHESRSWVKTLHGQIAHEIPAGWRICGENLYAKHSIHYHHLKSYFYMFSIWNDANISLSWNDTIQYAEILNLQVVPVVFKGIWTSTTKSEITDAFNKYQQQSKDEVEGYVIRLADQITFKDYRRCCAKWVRKSHVKTSQFWLREKLIPNELEIL
jgi:hypothetical protein